MDRALRLRVTRGLLMLVGPDGTAEIVDSLTAGHVVVDHLHTEKDGTCEHCSFLAAQSIEYPCPTRKALGSGPKLPCTCGKCEP